MMESETIAAIATAPGRGGVAVVRVSGPDAHKIAQSLTGRTITAKDAGRFFHATFRAGSVAIDDGLVLVFAAPRSYTGEDVIEFQGHGGSVTPRRVLEACIASGARLARRGEFTQRAFLNGRLDLGSAEAVIDLVDARTDRAADDALARLRGGAAEQLEKMYLDAIDISSKIEHSLDFSEDELPEGFDADVAASVEALLECAKRKLSTAREGKMLREGALVVLAGAPNAGKSSLMNALLGEGRAIVSSEAGTTRDSIEEWMEIEGWPVRLVDTAGLREAEGAIEAEGVARAEKLIEEADVVLRLAACDSLCDKGDDNCDVPDRKASDNSILKQGKISEKEIFVVSKSDLISESGVQGCGGSFVYVSSKTGEGLERLKKILAEKLSVLARKSNEETGADVTTRQKECLLVACEALERALDSLGAFDWVVAANEVRATAEVLGRILGKVYSDDLLDALFSRFCIGK